jgi:EAL domain-containing protein (putative c-di-GMP-specific phosphodiesterase class I)
LHKAGVSLSVDDFGTGYSSLERLLHLPIDLIKIDKSFICDIASSERSLNLVRAVITLGHSLGARLVAEGIETEAQRQIVHGLGCDFGQGFHIAAPMSSVALNEFLTTSTRLGKSVV